MTRPKIGYVFTMLVRPVRPVGPVRPVRPVRPVCPVRRQLGNGNSRSRKGREWKRFFYKIGNERRMKKHSQNLERLRLKN